MVNLREINKEDKDLLIQYLNNKNTIQHLSSKIPHPYKTEDAEWWINIGSKQDNIGRAIEYSGTFCGVISASEKKFEYSHSAEVGYWIGHEYWDKGIATSALSQFTAYIFNQTEIIRLSARVFSENKASMKVLEKAGYSLEGIFEKAIYNNGNYFNEHHFAKLRS